MVVASIVLGHKKGHISITLEKYIQGKSINNNIYFYLTPNFLKRAVNFSKRTHCFLVSRDLKNKGNLLYKK